MKDPVLASLMKEKMKALKPAVVIKVEVEGGEEQEKQEELKKDGLAPALPSEDKKMMAKHGQQMGDGEGESLDVGLIDELLSPYEQEKYQESAKMGSKPKTLAGKAEQAMAMKKVEKLKGSEKV